MPFDMLAAYDRLRLLHSNPITVTLTRPQSYSGGAQTSVAVQYVQEQPATQEQVDSPMGGSLDGERRAFRMWLVECMALPPFRDYLVVKADGSTWRIEKVETLCKGRSFRCHCIAVPGTLP